MDDTLARAGWRRCPDKDIIRSWEKPKSEGGPGGTWQWIGECAIPQYDISGLTPSMRARILVRPVHPDAGWDYCPEGWGAPAPVATVQDLGNGVTLTTTVQIVPCAVVPTEQGWWWRRDRDDPVKVFATANGALHWALPDHDWRCGVTDDGQWLGPCVKPGM